MSRIPAGVARHGTLLTRDGPLHISQGKYRAQHGPIDETLPWAEGEAEGGVSRAYMHHLCRMKEPLYDTLASMHNVRFMCQLMAEKRQSILNDEL